MDKNRSVPSVVCRGPAQAPLSFRTAPDEGGAAGGREGLRLLRVKLWSQRRRAGPPLRAALYKNWFLDRGGYGRDGWGGG